MEIGNEIEGSCGGFSGDLRDTSSSLFSYETIKQADPTAIVLNGGALKFLDLTEKIKDISEFWEEFLTLTEIDILMRLTFITITNEVEPTLP